MKFLPFDTRWLHFWKERVDTIAVPVERIARATESIDASRGRSAGLAIEGAAGGQPVAVEFPATSGAQPVSMDQLPPELNESGGLAVEGTEDGLPLWEPEPPVLAPAGYATGTLAFGSITTSFVLLLTPPYPMRLLALINGTDQAITYSFDGATPHGALPAYSAPDTPYAALGLKEARSVWIKATSTLPGAGAVYGNALL